MNNQDILTHYVSEATMSFWPVAEQEIDWLGKVETNPTPNKGSSQSASKQVYNEEDKEGEEEEEDEELRPAG